MAILKPGDFVGEISLLTNDPRSATVIAATDCQVCEITKDCMEHILKHRPEVGTALSIAVAERRLRLSAALANASPAQRIVEPAPSRNKYSVKCGPISVSGKSATCPADEG
ncbi:MAG: cyclic nucleotide-binding domain-containing protein [Candidatus Competibacteraceae bacterium]|nr:cyclic nucleotide-binding domain-containing protein [Candidatus Competibacteraceae bacterium]